MRTYTYTKTLKSGEFSADIIVTLYPNGGVRVQSGSRATHPETAAELTRALAEMEATAQARLVKLNDARHETLGALTALGYTLAHTGVA